MPGMCSVALGIWIKVGGRHESADFKGISHFLEHLLFKGTQKYSCRKIKESIEGAGGSLNAFTSEEFTCYLAKVPAAHLDLTLSVLSEMVIHPLLPEVEVKKERGVILEEIKMYKDLPQSYVYDLLDELLWPDQPLGMSVIGSVESVNRIQRNDLMAYQKRTYTPLNIVVASAGAISHEKFAEKVERNFFGLKDRNINTFLQAKDCQGKPQINILSKNTEQTHLALGFHSFKRAHPLRQALNLLHIIMGANMSSRLFEAVRESKGLAYEIGTQIKRFQDTGSFIVHAGIDNHKVNAAIEVIFKELEKVKHRLVSVGEFKRAKEFYLGQLALALEDTMDHMLWIGESTVSLDKTHSLNQIIKEAGKIKREDLRCVAQGIFKKENINLALIGPLEDKRDAIFNQLHIN